MLGHKQKADPHEGGVRLGGLPSLWIEGTSQWVSVSWEEQGSDAKHLLGSGIPEAISASITGFLEAMRSGEVTSEWAEWVLSLTDPSRALFGRPLPDDGQVSLVWQEALDKSEGVTQTVPMSELEKWPGALDLYGPADPDDVRSPDVYNR